MREQQTTFNTVGSNGGKVNHIPPPNFASTLKKEASFPHGVWIRGFSANSPK